MTLERAFRDAAEEVLAEILSPPMVAKATDDIMLRARSNMESALTDLIGESWLRPAAGKGKGSKTERTADGKRGRKASGKDSAPGGSAGGELEEADAATSNAGAAA